MKHVLGFSGGIDSQACARFLLNRYPADDVILMNSDAGGNEHPITTEFIDWYDKHIHPIIRVTARVGDLGKKCKTARESRGLTDDSPMDFALMSELHGMFPDRRHQFCTQYLKLVPQRRWLNEHLSAKGVDFVRYSGVRREEGKQSNSWRANVAYEGWDDVFSKPLFHPVFDWSKKMCFDYVTHHGESFNELYKLGFDRVGCSPCVNANKKDVRNWFVRFPERLERVREWEKRTGATFFKPMVPGMAINWIDDVVEWSKTKHGGKELDLTILEEPASCDSRYGLCE